MQGLTKVPFPKRIDSDSLWLDAFSPAIADELWKSIITDRENQWRKNIWPGIKNKEELVEYLSHFNIENPDSSDFAYLIRSTNGAILGSFHIHNVSWWNKRVEVGYWAHHSVDGRGFVSGALKLVENVLKNMGFHRIEIRCNPFNRLSYAVAERNGYVKEGILRQDTLENGTFRDTVIYGKLL